MASQLDNATLGQAATARAASTYAQVRKLEANLTALRRKLEREVADAEAHGVSHERIANALALSRTRIDQMIQAVYTPPRPRRSRD
jgi:DNA-directed RNA polymerase specialized sigma24 family protein